jgi:2-iminobutanoate/2-iminopropanoate deaminase
MDKAAVTSAAAPAPAGPYSPALQVDDWLFLSGQGGFDPATGALSGATIEEQTEQTFRNISALLEAAGQGVGAITEVRPAGEIVHEMMAEARRLLAAEPTACAPG